MARTPGRGAGEHAALFYRLSRFELIAQGDFWLSETPELPSRGWDARSCPRVISWARLRDRRMPAGPRWLVLSVHFDHRGRVAQWRSTQLLRRWLQQRAGDDLVLLMGDFNLGPESAAMALLRESLNDARAHSETPPRGLVATFHAFGRLPEGPRIDHLLVDPRLRVLGYEVIAERLTDGRHPSDHDPVMATLLPR